MVYVGMFCLNDVNLAKICELTKAGMGELYIAVKTESAMTTYYYSNPEEALRQARIAGKRPGCYYGGITLPSGKKGWAIYRGGKVVEQYAIMSPGRK